MPYTQVQAPKPLVGAFASPWPGTVEVRVADRLVASVSRAMTYGRLAAALSDAPISRRLATGCLVDFASNSAPPTTGKAALYGLRLWARAVMDDDDHDDDKNDDDDSDNGDEGDDEHW